MNAAMVVDGEPLSKKKQSNVLAKQYAEKSTRHPNAPRINMPRIPKVPLALISMGEPDAALKAMHMGSAPGPVAVHCDALQRLPVAGKKFLPLLFNKSLASGLVPKYWKEGIIVPLLKPGKPLELPDTNRPVTLTSNLCKLVERVVAQRIRDAVEERLLPYQAGFRPQRSTADPLVGLMPMISDRKPREKVDAVRIDYARAFDSVDHGWIIWTLEMYQVDGYITRWVADFLTGRTSRVRIGHAMSDPAVFTCGVPQGSVLGPLLFIIVMDTLSVELARIPGLEHASFADHLIMVARGETKEEVQLTLQRGLDCIERWTRSHFVELSAPKTHTTHYLAHTPSTSYTCT